MFRNSAFPGQAVVAEGSGNWKVEVKAVIAQWTKLCNPTVSAWLLLPEGPEVHVTFCGDTVIETVMVEHTYSR